MCICIKKGRSPQLLAVTTVRLGGSREVRTSNRKTLPLYGYFPHSMYYKTGSQQHVCYKVRLSRGMDLVIRKPNY